MFGCLRRLGCLVIVLVGVLAYFTRGTWRPLLERTPGRDGEATATAAAPPTWQPLDQPSAERGERAVRALAARRGPVYVSLRAGELGSYAFLSLSESLPAALRDAETAVIGDRVYVRALVSPADLPGLGAGALGGLLPRRDTLRLGGTFDVVRPGLAQFRVRDVQIGRVPVPAALVPRVVARVRRGAVPAGVAADAFPIPVPDYIGDVRIARGRVTLYKATP
jgi:hypothetical protein